MKLIDFGVARAEGRRHQTRTGLIKGKLAYMAPEQITGEPIDGRSDLFALAEVIYQLSLGRHPFYAASDAAVLQLVVESRPVPPSAVDPKFPPTLGAILLKALRRDPGERFPTARAMRDAIEAFMLDRVTMTSHDTLGRYVRELFADRLALERRARQERDDERLVEALRVGTRPANRFPTAHAIQLDLERVLARHEDPVTASDLAEWLHTLFAKPAQDEIATDSGVSFDEDEATSDDHRRLAPEPR